MLTVDFDRFGVLPGERVLDMGCGAGRHAFELYRRGADVVALDQNTSDLAEVAVMFEAMAAEGQVPTGSSAATVEGDALALPFDDGEFDRIIAAEILEHIPDDRTAMEELFRVLKPGGVLAVTVPRWFAEKVNWALSDAYHEVEGGHVRIYKESELRGRLEDVGFVVDGRSFAHALHSPYWWLKCAVGVDNDTHPLVTAYHRVLVWDIMKAPALTRAADRLLNPVVAKSVVVYCHKPA
ncbi:MAG TPA: class I SAM-dependent methyltransferase [Phycicoccus elongatus]|jgi:SAM-dependent methyltransferase|uniref:class I SAM-dependent methyltransferase n=1 Tax=Phycicoccus TaxID=367298 RepID=UPI001DEA080C|nr:MULTISPECIES: class I SAM-dependent methyltransferase [Phycicoccus]MCB1240537.1 class I SAM-dependent methyltransferase [Tetrasphaera sp.]MCB9407559.1 class I SAM-dependent methyltransferase [Tetrasphaera sp.]MCO5301889.1 class I SAM-dependent methyltransferase [Phycicoccus sp.]HOA67386.1 class I SAM-dependent methyltransferase [Phycicoccus elongatus]HPF76273.1 class I SAM-dependent methyltransferase [Phycicoccus elongatus]